MIDMLKQNFFVNLIIILQIGAVIEYTINRKWIHAAYWFSGVVANIVVTHGIKK